MRFLINSITSLFLLFTYSLKSQTDKGTFSISPANTKIEFSARHLGVLKVTGTFSAFGGYIVIKDNIIHSVKVSITAESIHTDNEFRDKSLKSEQFLDTHNYPIIEVTLNENKSSTVLNTQVTIKNIMATVPINYELMGNTHGKYKITGNCTLSRNRFLLDFGTMDDLISDSISIILSVSLD
jgi:polyisoprenoid-binding protein YceI